MTRNAEQYRTATASTCFATTPSLRVCLGMHWADPGRQPPCRCSHSRTQATSSASSWLLPCRQSSFDHQGLRSTLRLKLAISSVHPSPEAASRLEAQREMKVIEYFVEKNQPRHRLSCCFRLLFDPSTHPGHHFQQQNIVTITGTC